MRYLAIFLLMATPAAAHPGHIIGAGHDHWLAVIAIGAAVAAGLWGALKGDAGDKQAEEAAEDDAAETETA